MEGTGSVLSTTRWDDTEIVPPLGKPEYSEHAPRATLFGPIRIVMLEITGGADATVENFLGARVAALPDNLCGKINFVMRWPDTWAQLGNEVARLNSKFLPHRFDRASNDSQRCPFLP